MTEPETRRVPLLCRPEGECWYGEGEVVILDRRRLPDEVVYHRCADYEAVARAIEAMVIQGAGALAMAAGYGLALALWSVRDAPVERQGAVLREAAERLRRTRPTGVHLFTTLEELTGVAEAALASGEPAWQAVRDRVDALMAERIEIARRTGENAAALLPDGVRVLTHCFAGPALPFMLHAALEGGKRVEVTTTETRPYLQGARLTAFAIREMGLPVTIITDGMVAFAIQRGLVDVLVTAADRIAMDGSVANKVGTYGAALAAHRHGLPFYVLGYRGPDRKTATGAEITIEMRDPREVLEFRGQRVAAPGADALYPAFDVTPPDLVSALVFARGVYRPAELGRFYTETGTAGAGAVD